MKAPSYSCSRERSLASNAIRRSRSAFATACMLLALVSIAHAKPGRDRTIAGDVIKAARFLATARLDDAKDLLSDLDKRAPDAPEVKWLHA